MGGRGDIDLNDDELWNGASKQGSLFPTDGDAPIPPPREDSHVPVTFRGGDSLREARRFVEAGKFQKNGVLCPCCGRRNAVDKVSIGPREAKQLMAFYSITRGDCMDRPYKAHALLAKFTSIAGANWGKLKHWGLIVSEDDRRAGSWMLTEKGKSFIDGRIRIPRSAYLAPGDELVGFSDDTVDVVAAIDSPGFDIESIYDIGDTDRVAIKSMYAAKRGQ